MNEQFLGLGESNQQMEKTPTASGTREKHVSRISVWRYVRPLVRNNNCSVRSRNRIGAFACDDSLRQCLAAVWLVPSALDWLQRTNLWRERTNPQTWVKRLSGVVRHCHFGKWSEHERLAWLAANGSIHHWAYCGARVRP